LGSFLSLPEQALKTVLLYFPNLKASGLFAIRY
jgi:hypothetical protein